MNSYPITKNSKIKRIAEKATYDTETIHQIIDEALFCHIGIILPEYLKNFKRN